MKISLGAPYKSLNPFTANDLPNFCVITGKNGSGKSQLIELINAKHQNLNNNFDLDVDRLRIQIGGMDHPQTSSLDPGLWHSRISQFWTDYASKLHLVQILKAVYNGKPDLSLLFISEVELTNFIAEFAAEEVRISLDSVNTFSYPRTVNLEQYTQIAAEQILERKLSLEVARMVSLKSRKELVSLSHQDFMLFPPEEKYIEKNHLFYAGIDRIFYSYAKRRWLNYNHQNANRDFGRNFVCVPDSEFIKEQLPPWQIANQIFDRHNINYAFEDLPPDIFVENIPIEFRLIKKTTGQRILFTNLSSGEKIIIALIVKLFTSDFYKQNLELPELVVLDEPDSHLHPELANLLINVLNETFVNQLGIKVLITTHSPSTVALAPESSLYELRNEPETVLQKVSKDQALKILTFGVPTLSIDYRNHRQVFVESPTDVFYYQSIYNVLSQKNHFIYKPYFISYGKGHGNCQQVIQLVNNLRLSGNDKTYGIVDWDGKKEGENFILVHGYNARYSIENFIYDPIFLVALFLEIGGSENVFSELGFTSSYNQYSIGEIESNLRLQEICDWVISKVKIKFPSLPGKNASNVQLEYLNGKRINIPSWYVEMKGHELEVKLKQTFLSLGGKFKSEGQMQESLTKIIAKSYPFLPIETVRLIQQISMQ